MAPDDIAADDFAIELIELEVIGADDFAAELLAAAADVVLVAVSEVDPQAARVRASAAPAIRITARFINTSAPRG